ncbi:retrotransposable element Tf2 [Tanacetum coccineum]
MNVVLETLTVRLQAMVDAAMGNGNKTLETARMNVEGTSRGPQSSQFTRMTKIEFPNFGGDDVRGWLQYIREMGGNVPWNNYRESILQRFDNAFDDSMTEIKNVRHVTTIEDYQNAFDKLISRVDLPVDQLVSFYIAGLQTEVELACSGQMFPLEVLVDNGSDSIEEEFLLPDCSAQPIQNETWKLIEYTPQMSLHALSGVPHFQTMRVCGHVGKYRIHTLIDSGSTHNFVDTNTATKIGCRISAIFLLPVDVANGNKLFSTLVCKKFTWQLQGEIFETDVMLVPLGGCKMVLGGKKMPQPITELSSLVLCVYHVSELSMIHASSEKNKEQQDPVIVQLLQNYEDVFDVPNILPPERAYDHKIVLKEGVVPVNVRPYRHPPTQKDAIESMVRELLESGVIRKSQSSFASPMVMTIKDKFSIPIIEELIDDLQGYYRRFIRSYAVNSHPLTQLLKKNSFHWNQTAQAAFKELKQAMIKALVLKLPNFEEKFVIKTDVLGVVLELFCNKEEKGKLVVGDDKELKHALLVHFHNDFVNGHSGGTATVNRLGGLCYWKKMRHDVKKFMALCGVCQRNKADLAAYLDYFNHYPSLI